MQLQRRNRAAALAGRLAGAAGTLQSLGLRTSLAYAFGRIVGAFGLVFHRYRLIAVPVASLPERLYGFRPVTVAPGDARLRELGIPAVAEQFRRAQGMHCIGIERDDHLVGVVWLAVGRFIEDEAPLRFLLPATCAWDTGLVLDPAARGTRAFAALWAAARRWLVEHRLDWSLSRVTHINAASWKAHERMNAKSLGYVTVLRAGTVQLALGARPRLTRAPAVASVVLDPDRHAR